MENTGTNRHFFMLQKIIVMGYSCRAHGKLYSHFHKVKKSLFCRDCLNEMNNISNIIHFQSKQEIISKLLNIFNIKICSRHKKNLTYFCLSEIKYYCDECKRLSNCRDVIDLKMELVNEVAPNNISEQQSNIPSVTMRSKVQIFNQNSKISNQSEENYSNSNSDYEYDSSNESSYINHSDEEDEDERNMFIAIWSKNQNNISNTNVNNNINSESTMKEDKNKISSVTITHVKSNKDNLPTVNNSANKNNSQKQKNDITTSNNCNINNNITTHSNVKSITLPILPATIIGPTKSLNFFYYFINNGKLIIYESFKNNYKKLKFTNKFYDHSQIVKHLSSNLYIDSTYIYCDNSFKQFDNSNQVVWDIAEISEKTRQSLKNIVGVTSDNKIVGISDKYTLNLFDLISKSIEEIETQKCEFDDSYLVKTKSSPLFEFKQIDSPKKYLLIGFDGIRNNSFSFFIYNNNHDNFNLIFENKFKSYNFDNQNEDISINNNFKNKILFFCKLIFFYLKNLKLFLCFILTNESFHFEINLDLQNFKLVKNTQFDTKAIGFNIDGKADNENLYIQSDENIFYLNKDNVLIQYELTNALFSQIFEFI